MGPLSWFLGKKKDKTTAPAEAVRPRRRGLLYGDFQKEEDEDRVRRMRMRKEAEDHVFGEAVAARAGEGGTYPYIPVEGTHGLTLFCTVEGREGAVAVDVPQDATVQTAAAQCANVAGITAAAVEIHYGGQPLVTPHATLADCGIGNECSVVVVPLRGVNVLITHAQRRKGGTVYLGSGATLLDLHKALGVDQTYNITVPGGIPRKHLTLESSATGEDCFHPTLWSLGLTENHTIFAKYHDVSEILLVLEEDIARIRQQVELS
eukprot:Hpha_TRINITY_DN15820_c1_g8::TRINITY_DN15820_c1_g8_i1::g.187136::m.187136